MIRMRPPTTTDHELMKPILKKHALDQKLLLQDENNSFIMLEKNKVIGLSNYFSYHQKGVIHLMAYDMTFMDNDYRDAFFRGTLNLMLNNGLFEAIVMTTKANDSFYRTYGFESIDEEILQALKKKNLNTNEVINAYTVDIDAFFNRPCQK